MASGLAIESPNIISIVSSNDSNFPVRKNRMPHPVYLIFLLKAIASLHFVRLLSVSKLLDFLVFQFRSKFLNYLEKASFSSNFFFIDILNLISKLKGLVSGKH